MSVASVLEPTGAAGSISAIIRGFVIWSFQISYDTKRTELLLQAVMMTVRYLLGE